MAKNDISLKQIPVPILTKVYILSNQKHIFIIIFSAENVDHWNLSFFIDQYLLLYDIKKLNEQIPMWLA